MPRDYKNSARKPRKPPPTPAWVWMLSGFIAGLGVALAVHLYHLSAPAASAPSPARAAVPASQTAEDDPEDMAEDDLVAEKDRYQFYDLLKDMEVVVPDEPVAPARRAAATLSPTTPSATSGATLPPTPAGGGPYLIQTGSFRGVREAEAMRASLGLLGLTSHIQKAVDDKDRTWHRVHVGPLADEQELTRVKRLLAQEKIAMLVLRKKP